MISLEVPKDKYEESMKLYNSLKQSSIGSFTVELMGEYIEDNCKLKNISILIVQFYDRLGKKISDKISREEFAAGIAVENFTRRLFSNDPNDPVYQQFMEDYHKIDLDKNKKIDLQEAKAYLKTIFGELITEEEYINQFNMFDLNPNRSLELDEFKMIWASLMYFNVIVLT